MPTKRTVDEIYKNVERYVQLGRQYQNPDEAYQRTILNIQQLPEMGKGYPLASTARAMPFAFYRDMFRGGPAALNWIQKYEQETDESWRQRQRRLFGVNYTRPLVNKIVQSEYGQPLVFDFEEPEGPEAVWYNDLEKNGNLHAFRIVTARQRAVDGASVVQVWWDAESGDVRFRHILPEHVFPVVGDDYDQIEAVIIRMDRPRADMEGSETVTQIWVPGDSGLWIGDERQPNLPDMVSYDFLPFVFYQGPRLVSYVFGDSLIRGAAELNHAINLVANNIAEMIRYQGFSLLVITGQVGGMEVDPKTGEGRLRLSNRAYLHLGSAPETTAGAEYITPSPKIGESLEVLDKWTRYMFETGGVPIVSVAPQQTHQESGLSRSVSFIPLVDLINELWTCDEGRERELVRMAMRIANAHATGAPALDIEAEFQIREPAGVVPPSDEKTQTDVLMAKREAGWITDRDAVRDLNPFMSEAELDEKMTELEEVQAEKRQADLDAARQAMESAGFARAEDGDVEEGNPKTPTEPDGKSGNTRRGSAPPKPGR